VAGWLLLAFASVAPGLPADSETRSTAPILLDAGSPGGEPSRGLVACMPELGQAATVAPRATEPRASTATFAPVDLLQAPIPVRSVAATEVGAGTQQAGGVARWCVAHATSTHAP